MARLLEIWRFATTEGVPRRSLYVAMIVGTILNLINQGDALVGGTAINFVKLGLTYCVPFCVSTFGAVSYRLRVAQMQRKATSMAIAKTDFGGTTLHQR